jgi:ABC transport system ATP-binding/permease protein
MNILTVENLTKSYGEKLLFEDLTFGISAGQKIALIARNGTGKSSLIKIITGLEYPDSGMVARGNNLRISYLPQNPEMNPGITILDYLFDSDSPLIRLVYQYNLVLSGKLTDKHEAEKVMTRMDELQAWNFESKIREILGKFDIRHLEQTIKELSGGMRKKVALARALIEEADLVILDEPTNHLDVDTIEWLENYLKRQSLAIFLVTHDRYFLDNVCDQILELDNQKIYKYRGNYTYFLEKREERMMKEKTEIQKARSLYKTELEWMKRMPQARATKAKAREDAFYSIEEKAHSGTYEETRAFDVDMQRLGGKILELHNIDKSYGNQKILDGFTYIFNKGDRIGLIGKNGVGKSTLLEIIMGSIKADKGKITVGKTVEFGYFRQDGLPVKEDKRIIDIVKDIAEQVQTKKGSMTPAQFLSYFNFNTNIHYNYFSSLSGGEKRKLFLLTTLLKKPNFLILDEPTNDLDIETLNKLEEFLENYEGCLMIVSHDRYFMDHMVEHIFAFQGDGKIKDYWGNYSAYASERKIFEKAVAKTDKQKNQKKDKKPKNQSDKPTYKEIKEFESLEKEIENLEAQKDRLIEQLNQGDAKPEQLQQWSKDIAGLMDEIDKKSDRWIGLSEKMEGFVN